MKLNNKGDTIVEVLIAMTVLATVVGGAYATANRAMIQSQQSQEHIQGTKIAESQIEQLKSWLDYNPGQIAQVMDPAQPFCFRDTQRQAYNPTNCVNGIYDKRIVFVNSSPGISSHFEISVKWDSYHSATQDNITMLYKVQL